MLAFVERPENFILRKGATASSYRDQSRSEICVAEDWNEVNRSYWEGKEKADFDLIWGKNL